MSEKRTMREHASRVLAHQQAAQATAAPSGPRVVAGGAAPRGRKLAGNLGPGSLYPGVGRLVQRTGQPQRCGTIAGRIFGVTEHPNSMDAKRISSRFAGQFVLVDHQGTVLQGVECYLPSTVERGVKAALRLRETAGQGEPVPLAIEVWCEPDQEGRPRSPLGYSFVSYDLAPQGENNPLMSLAYEAGIFERPAPQPALPDLTDADPETGEIGSGESAAAA